MILVEENLPNLLSRLEELEEGEAICKQDWQDAQDRLGWAKTAERECKEIYNGAVLASANLRREIEKLEWAIASRKVGTREYRDAIEQQGQARIGEL